MAYGAAPSTLTSLTLSDNQLVSFGKLVGVEEAPSLTITKVRPASPPIDTTSVDNVFIVSGDTSLRTDLINAQNTKRDSGFNLFEHLGGGVLGSQMFIMKNTNLTNNQIAPGVKNDPDDVIARRISARIFEDLLCHQLPTLTETDVIANVNPASSHGFHLSTSCLSCHVSLDPMA